MTKVRGQFEVTLTTAIAVDFDVSQQVLDELKFDIGDAQVAIQPPKITPPIDYGDGDYEPPVLTDIMVWIMRSVNLVTDSDGYQLLPREEEAAFEPILITATRRFVTLLRQSIGQWSLDTRHPIQSYVDKYMLGDSILRTTRPLSISHRKLPQYATGTITLATQKALTTSVWEEISDRIRVPVRMPIYEEFLYDARTFRAAMQYESAILFAAFSAELMLGNACKKLLTERGSLTSSQCEEILRGRNNPYLISLVEKLDSTRQINEKNLLWLFKQRNGIVHGKTSTSTGNDARKAIQTTQMLKSQLSGLLRPPS